MSEILPYTPTVANLTVPVIIPEHKITRPDRHPTTDDTVIDGAPIKRNRTSGSMPEGKDRKIRPGCQGRDIPNCAICNETGNPSAARSPAQVLANNSCLDICTGVDDDNLSRFGGFDGMDSGTNIARLAPGGHGRA
jgi:hypothetical protein